MMFVFSRYSFSGPKPYYWEQWKVAATEKGCVIHGFVPHQGVDRPVNILMLCITDDSISVCLSTPWTSRRHGNFVQIFTPQLGQSQANLVSFIPQTAVDRG